MNSVDRQTLASSVAVVLYLLLVYGLVGQLDCASEQRTEEAHKPLPSRLLCETASNRADPHGLGPGAIRLVGQYTSQPTSRVVLRCESFEP
jgi:hypothetical protein